MAVRNRPRTLAEVLDERTAEGTLYERLPDGKVRCYACGHRCTIFPGKRGICRVRFNEGGVLRVPWGYVAALQCDPTEKKPFYHVLPGSRTLTFGMLGCDFHCPYCFPGDTEVATARGLRPLSLLFGACRRVVAAGDGAVGYPDGLEVVAGSGRLRRVRAVFKHPYRGQLVVLRPLLGPEIRCTPGHRVYATSDPRARPAPVEARRLTRAHFLAIPRRPVATGAGNLPWHPPVSVLPGTGAERAPAPRASPAVATARALETDDFLLVPIREVARTDYAGDVYNLEVDEEHTYLAGGVVVGNCQNWVTSQALRDPVAGVLPEPLEPEQIVQLALRSGAQLVGSSYNEPLITAEWAVTIFRAARGAGLRTCFISNGNATPEVLQYLRPWTDCYTVDLKAYDDRRYRALGGTLESVTRTIALVHGMGFWLEVVTLVVPGFNDGDDELRAAAEYIASISPLIPWHVTAFHKDYRMTDPDDTSPEDLLRAARIGEEAGLKYVYAGNLPGQVGRYEHTFCHHCGELLVERSGYRILRNRLSATGGRCPSCGTAIPGIWQ